MTREQGDKRKFLRLTITRKAKCRFLGDEGSRFNLLSRVEVDVELINLSIAGACINCTGSVGANAVRENRLVELVVRVPNKPVALPGRVVWCRRDGTEVRAGVAFEGIAEEDGRMLLEYLSRELRFSKV